MQLRGWGLTQASRIVIIIITLLVVQPLGAGQILALPPATAGVASYAPGSQVAPALTAVSPPAIQLDAGRQSSAVLGEPDARAALPDPAPLPRRLPRAPPAV